MSSSSGLSPSAESDAEVLAAGGVIWRVDDSGRGEVVLAHRPRYDDWSFPKGKLDPGETLAECARREVAEETGFDCALGDELLDVHYIAKGRRKLVRYWLMTVIDGDFVPNDEVDEIRWLPTGEAAEQLSYDHDVTVLEAAAGVLGW